MPDLVSQVQIDQCAQKAETHAPIPRFRILFLFLLTCLMLACQNEPVEKIVQAFEPTATPTQTPTETVTPTWTPSPEPTSTPTPEPDDLGSETNPLIMSFVSAKMDPKAGSAAEQVAKAISDLSGLTVKSELSPNYDWTLQGMSQNAVHITWLPPLTYVYAQQQGYADTLLLTEQFGLYQYGVQFLVNPASKFKIYYDIQKSKSTADAAVALQQFKNKKPCWVDETSASGFVFPFGLLKTVNVQSPEGIFMKSHAAIIRALYVGGICDFGVTYALFGDPRTASDIQKSIPDVMEKVIVVWASDEVIPNLNLAVHPSLTAEIREKITTAFLEFIKEQTGPTLLTEANTTQIDNLKPASNSDYDVLRQAAQASGIDLQTTIGK
jgi:phosphonate transport system substrate-binding protein